MLETIGVANEVIELEKITDEEKNIPPVQVKPNETPVTKNQEAIDYDEAL